MIHFLKPMIFAGKTLKFSKNLDDRGRGGYGEQTGV
jgi:hypothetical protein